MLVRGKSLRWSSSNGLGWNNIVVEHHLAEPGERQEKVVDEIFVKLACGKLISRGERMNWQGRPVPYCKEPGTIFLHSEGLLPLVRPSTQTELIVCMLNPTFVREVGEELRGNHPDIHARTSGFRDSALNSLMRLLEEESRSGGSLGRLYVEHLTYALTVRLLSLGMKRASCQSSINVLPASRLHRVIDRMKAGLSSDLDLKTLAMESGYSRNHFLRMFRAATGNTPHQYVLRLRVNKARELMKNRSMHLIDIALECGFSSHPHLSRAFRQILNATPSEYRREVL